MYSQQSMFDLIEPVVEKEKPVGAPSSDGIKPVLDKNVIILLDLNYTLVANSEQKRLGGPVSYSSKIEKETYRQWLVDLIKGHTVLLCTVRGTRYERQTMMRIESQTGWKPAEAYFNPTPEVYEGWIVKAKYLPRIFTKYGEPSETIRYFAIESATRTRAMFQQHKIPAAPQSDCYPVLPLFK